MLFEASQRAPEAMYAAATLDTAARDASSVEGAGESGHVAGLDHSVG